jgi:hypothetical protein
MPVLGLLMLQTRFPRLPGDVGHVGSFAFPVHRRIVQGATPERVVRGRESTALQPFIDAALALVDEGCSAIATSCGFMALWQQELQAALPVPVWTSSLLQLADRNGGRCGVITIEASSLTAEHFVAVGADPSTPIEGITPGCALHRTLLLDLPDLDPLDAQFQVLAAADRLLERHPDVDTLVLECTNLPPYADALRQHTALEVLDVLTLINERMSRLRGPRGAAPDTETPAARIQAMRTRP